MCIALICLAFAGLVVPENNNRMRVFVANLEEYARLNADQAQVNADQALVISEHSNTIETLTSTIESLNATIQEHETNIDDNKADIQALQKPDGIVFIFLIDNWNKTIIHPHPSLIENNPDCLSLSVAFHVLLRADNAIPVGTTVKFNIVNENKGNGWVAHADLLMSPGL